MDHKRTSVVTAPTGKVTPIFKRGDRVKGQWTHVHRVFQDRRVVSWQYTYEEGRYMCLVGPRYPKWSYIYLDRGMRCTVVTSTLKHVTPNSHEKPTAPKR